MHKQQRDSVFRYSREKERRKKHLRKQQGCEKEGGGYRGRLGEGAVIVGFLHAVLGVPRQPEAVGQDARRHRGAIVAAPANHHDTVLGYGAHLGEGSKQVTRGATN